MNMIKSAEFKKLEKLLSVGDDRTIQILRYYTEIDKEKYIPHLVKALEIVDHAEENKDYVFNVIKTTRAGFTTNSLLACLIRDKKVCIVEPTNEISYSTVRTIMDLYVEITGDDGKIVRQIPSNRDGCSEVVEKLMESEALNLIPFVIAGKCSTCGSYGWYDVGKPWLEKATDSKCTILTMMKEKEMMGDDWKPDVVTITYDKMLTLNAGERGEFYQEMLNNTEVMIFDELGVFVSKIEQGMSIHEERTWFSEVSTSGAKDMEKELMKLIVTIPNKNTKKRMLELMTDYVKEFIDEGCIPTSKLDVYPKFVLNPLNKKLKWIKIKLGEGFSKWMWLSKTEIVGYKFNEIYEDLEVMIEASDEKTQESIIWLLKIMQVMQHKMLVAYETGGLEFVDGMCGKEDVEIKNINIVPMKEKIIGQVEKFMENKINFFTDATMPAFSFEGFNHHVVDIYFGDPVKTNSKLLVMSDLSLSTFSVTRWNKDKFFRDGIIKKIEKIIEEFGSEIVVWTPNKKIWLEVIARLNDAGIENCTHEKEEIGKVQITYFGSIMTRGVNSTRRIQVMLGKANKPKGSFKHVAFMQRVQWGTFDKYEINKMAKNVDMESDEFKELIEKWVKEFNLEDYVVRTNDVPEELSNYFKFYAESIQKERTYMDTWQAGSRAKDSLASERSVLLCIGWKNTDIWEMLKWGSNNSVNYVLQGEETIRVLKKQRNVIAPPQVVDYSGFDDINAWMKEGRLNCDIVGFDVDLQVGISDMLNIYGGCITSEQVWMEVSRNMRVGETSELYDNGYLVGSIRGFLEYNDLGTDILSEEIDDGNFIFKISEEDKEHVMKKKFSLDELIIICKILKIAFFVKKDKVAFKDIRKLMNKKVESKSIKRGLRTIFAHKLLEGSTWKSVVSKHKGFTNIHIIKNISEKKERKIKSKKIDIKMKAGYISGKVLKYVIHWYEDETEIDLRIGEISKDIFGSDIKKVREIIRDMYESGSLSAIDVNCKLINKEGRNEKLVREVAKF